MARPTKSSKTTRNSYSDEFRAEALGLADSIGVSAAARRHRKVTALIYFKGSAAVTSVTKRSK